MDKYLPLVSIIIPNYNHADFIKQRIESILSQTYFTYEIILLDDYSTDNSREVLNSFRDNSKIKFLIFNEVNSGSVFKQWELGLSYAKGELIWIAESDDFGNPKFLEKLVPYFENPKVVLAYCRSYDVNQSGEIIDLSFKHLPWCYFSFCKSGEQEVSDHLFIQCTIPNASAVLFRKSCVDLDFFQNDFKLCGDWNFYLNILRYGDIVYDCEPLSYHRFHPDTVRSKSVKNINILKERILIVETFKVHYRLSKLKYYSSVSFQINNCLSELKISNLIGPLGLEICKTLLQLRFFFIFLFFYFFIKKVHARLISFKLLDKL